MTQTKIAIIGAGMSGLTLAQELSPHAEVTVFEKSRGVGGRMATRRAEQFVFDHGTQFFTVKNPEFQAWLEPFIQRGLIAEWNGNVISIDAANAEKPAQIRPWPEPHYVAVPTMNALAKHLSQNLEIILNAPIARLPQEPKNPWHLMGVDGNPLGLFNWVISTAPPAQTVSLFTDHLPPVSQLADTTMQGCYTLMLGFDQALPSASHAPIAARIRNSPIEWIAINSTKPGRDRSTTTLIAHSSNAWAQDHIDDDQAGIQAFLLSQLKQLTQRTGLLDLDVNHASQIAMHRWRYALKPSTDKTPQAPAPYLDPSLKLAAASDWCSASRIEDAWLSARALAAGLRPYL